MLVFELEQENKKRSVMIHDRYLKFEIKNTLQLTATRYKL